MNIVMVTNYPPAKVLEKLNKNFVNEGWVQALQDALLGENDISLFVLYPQKDSKDIVEDKIAERFYSFGFNNDPSEDAIQNVVKALSKIEKVDVIHIMGTEFPHSLSVYEACESLGMADKVVVSMQGLVSFCTDHYHFGVPKKYTLGCSLVEVAANFSSLEKSKKAFEKRGAYEIQLLKNCKHVIGRTLWDKRCAKLLNPDVHYHFNGENLRDDYYGAEKWNLNECEKHSIFISQATYPLKGLHHVLKYLPEIVRHYPDTKLYIGGSSPIHSVKWKQSSYARYLLSLIKKGNLEKNVVFCGRLSAKGMKERYLKANVFLSPSNIENSSNSIGEAMILGTPVVASDVGGTSSIITDEIEGLTYHLNEPYIMVQNILSIFSDDELANKLSDNAQKRAGVQYDRKKNISELIEIYRTLGDMV